MVALKTFPMPTFPKILTLILVFVAVATADEAFFESKIRPVLAENCYQCHSAKAVAEGKLKGGLQLDTRAGIQTGGDTGPAVVPGKLPDSLILRALRHEGDLKMPPKNKLSATVAADFQKWIEMGAPDPRDGMVATLKKDDVDIAAGQKHWAFRPLAKTAVPEISHQKWARTEIDQFIRARQESAKVGANRVAELRTLVRRAYFDLIGLPPTPEQVSSFVASAEEDFDSAWPALIDELLASPHYGERWGRHWLDLVRFAESNGYAFDKDRPNAWRYRDWVINALNADMPYDEFVRQQVAGDLFAGADWDNPAKAKRALELVSATGFIVAGPFTTQQTQKERERSRYEQLDDMIHTLGTSMLGLTVGCARCHDHKYDPIGTHDYYELAAMFGNVGFSDIGVDLDPKIYRDAKAVYDETHRPLVSARTERETELKPGLDAFLADHAKPKAIALGLWQSIGPFKARNFNVGFAEPFGPEKDLDFVITKTFEEGAKKEERGWKAQPDWKDGEVHNAVLKGTNSVFYLQRDIFSPKSQSVGLSVSGNDGIKIWVNGYKVGEEKRGGDAKVDELKVNLPLSKGNNRLIVKLANGGGDAGFYFQTSLEKDREPKNVVPVLKIAAEKRNDGHRKTLLSWFRTHDRRWSELNADVVKHAATEPEADLTLTYAAKPRGTSYQFGGNTYKVFHLHRGNADNKKDEARAGFLRVLSRASEGNWLGEEDPEPDSRWTVLKPVSASAEVTKLQIGRNGQITVTGKRAATDTYTIELPLPDKPAKITALRMEVAAAQSANFVLSQLRVRLNGQPIEIESAVANFTQSGFSAADILRADFARNLGWAIAGGVGKDNELVLVFKNPLAVSGGKLDLTLVQQSQWPQHLITHFSFATTTEADVRGWAAKPEAPATPDPNKPQSREALADWLTDAKAGAGPLLARVMVNRLWQHHFGRGIVATPSDFGTRGERPSHPELLEWLASQLLANDWRLKPIHRQIMASAVYLQGSGDVPGMANDPENLLFWRKPSRRLEAEAIRDNLLAVSGKLDPKAGGKGTLDAKSARRSVYLTVKRGRLVELLQLFDAPDAMQSIGNRETSTVAPQALAMLNSEAVRNWAIDLSKRAKPTPETTVEQGIQSAYEITYSRVPTADEQAAMLAFIEHQSEGREGKADTAFEDFCHLLLCANEFIYVD